MSVFNGEKYIARGISSILKQTYTNFEFIIINDGSTDATADIVNGFNDQRIIFIDNKQNFGIPRSTNSGIKIAKGEFIAIMDADDESLPERLQMQMDYLQNHPDIGVLGTAMLTIKEGNCTIFVNPITHNKCLDWLTIGSCFANPTVIMRKSALGNTLYDERYLFSQDYKFWTDLAKKKVRFANIKTPLLKYYRHPTAVGIANIKSQDIYARDIKLDYIRYIFGTEIIAKFTSEVDWIVTPKLDNNIITMPLSKLSNFYNTICQVTPLQKSAIRFLLRHSISHKLHLVRYRIFDKVAPILLYYYFGIKIKRLIK